MLKAQEDGEEDWYFVVEAIKRCFIVLVRLIEWPNVWCDEIQVVLSSLSAFSLIGL